MQSVPAHGDFGAGSGVVLPLDDVPATHFYQLAKFGERILLSIRFGGWSDIDDQELARNWARFWRPKMQGYIYAYNAATGVYFAANSH